MHCYSLYCAQSLPQWSSLIKKSVSGGSVIRGKSVKEELNTQFVIDVAKNIIDFRTCPYMPAYISFVYQNDRPA